MELQRTVGALAEHPVQEQRMEVDVELKSAPEALDHRHGAAPPIARASAARLLPIETEDGTHRDAENRAAELVIPGTEVAQSARQAEDPLAHRHRRKDVVDQVCGVRRHAAAAAARTEAPSFAGERHEPLERAVVAPNPRKAARERAAGQELAELALDEPRQTVPVAVIVGLAEERFQILADDAMLIPARAGDSSASGSMSRASSMEDRALCVSGLIARGAHERRASEVRAVRPGRKRRRPLLGAQRKHETRRCEQNQSASDRQTVRRHRHNCMQDRYGRRFG